MDFVCRHCMLLTSDVQGLIDVLHEAETFGTEVLILQGSAAQSSHTHKIAFQQWHHLQIV